MKRDFVVLWLSLAFALGVTPAQAQSKRPNGVYFLVDNLGMGELSVNSGGPLRGATTTRIDEFARQGMMLLNFAPEAQCTPSRSALMTGRYSIRSGNHTVALAGSHSGLVKWERTLGDMFSAGGYATAIVGKWHIGDSPGHWPTDHGFDEWYGIPRSYDEALWPEDPWYDPERDPVTRVLEGAQGRAAERAGAVDRRRASRHRRRVHEARQGLHGAQRRRRQAVLPVLQPLVDAPADGSAGRVQG